MPTTSTTIAADRSASPGNDFTVSLFKAVAGPGAPRTNLVLSPHGVDMVLSMAAFGARGKTADELASVLGHRATPAELTALATLEGDLRGRTGDGVTLDLSASVWVDRAFTPLPDYRTAVEGTLGAVPHVVDFAHDPAGAAAAINADVADATHGHIPSVLKTPLDPATVMVLVSAAYLDARWAQTFEASNTKPADFHLADGRVVRPQTMGQTAGLAIGSGPGWRAVALPYAGGGLAMLIVVPDDLAAFERGLTGAAVDGVAHALRVAGPVDLTLPRFRFRTAAPLKRTLTDMGIGLAFTDGADFSGIAPPPPGLKIGFVQHEAWVQVDEAGTKAAAATAGGMVATALRVAPPPPTPFPVDRPFMFFIRDDATGAVLFIGRVADPMVGE